MTIDIRTPSPSHFQALVEELDRNVGVLADAVTHNSDRISDVERKLDHRITQVEDRLTVFQAENRERFKQVDERFKQVDQRFDQVDLRLTAFQVETRERFAQVDKRFKHVDERFDQLERHVTAEIARVSVELARVSTELSRVVVHLGAR